MPQATDSAATAPKASLASSAPLFTAGQLADMLGGTLEGAPETPIHGLTPPEEAQPGALCFLLRESLAHLVPQSPAALWVVSHAYVPAAPPQTALLRVLDPGQAFIMTLTIVSQLRPEPKGIDARAYVDPRAEVHPDVYIGPFAVVSAGAVIGKGARIYPHVYVGPEVHVGVGTILYPGVVLYPGTYIGRNCILHAGVSIGADGFGFIPLPDGSRHKVPHIGGVILGDQVEIGAHTTIDRATIGYTRIGNGVKVDNLVMIAHNNRIGDHSVIAGQVGISGSCKIGSGVIMAGQVGLVDHIEIADRVTIGAQAGVSKDLSEVGGIYRGAPAQKIRDQIRLEAYIRRLPDLAERLGQLEKELEVLRAEISGARLPDEAHSSDSQ